jgi:sigma-54 dependent transcriptional regulator, acetoin dehydrogenase operon transcriptional activator AcoR
MVGDRSTRTTERVESASNLASGGKELAIQWVVDSRVAALEFLRAGRLRIGRGDECHLRLEHASVSRQHAELYRQGPIYALRDLQSTNGTWANGVRVEHTAIAAGDVLRFGDCIGIVFGLEPDSATLEFGSLAPGLWGGPTLASALANAKRAAPSDLPIVLIGETGVGKERIARALHHWSGRSGRFHAVNCSTVPVALAEAELFGHQRGAFTGADAARTGHFQAAHAGTLFLDEISELSLDVQAKLLRAVEEREITPLGATAALPIDVRIIAAAHEPLEALAEQQKFRADLSARVAGFVVEVPPLRQRREEIPGLCLQLLEKHAAGPAPRVAPSLLEWLCLREWPGNVRELEFMLRKLLALHGAESVLRLSFAQKIAKTAFTTGVEAAPSTKSGFRDRRESELYRLRQALTRTNGNLTAAAVAAGISRRRAYRLLDAAKSETDRPPNEEELQ